MTAPARLDVFAPITKRERDPKTGHLYVYGKITGPDLDLDSQGMAPEWLKAAVPDWFTRGNIREQHDSKRAVGKALELEEKPDGWYIGAKIVDKAAIEKVEEEVLTGFSIGIKGPRLDMTKADYPRGLVTGGRICETSLVDVPCYPTATIQDHWEIPLAKADGAGELQPVEEPELVRVDGDLRKADASDTYGLPAELFDRLAAPVKEALAALAAGGAEVAAEVKADSADEVPVVVNVTVKTAESDLTKYSAEEKRQALKQGQAMENANGDPSYVIKTKADLRKAIKAVGRGGADHDAIRKHVIARARALGLEGMVPKNWNADGSLKDAGVAKGLLADLEQLGYTAALLAKADDGEDGGGGMEDEQPDIDGATAAIAAIAALIISEAQSLAEGNLNEACDISLLLQAVEALKWFKCREENEQDDADMGLADGEPDLAKAAAKNGGKLAPPFKKKDDTDAEDGDGEEDGDEDDGKKKPAAKKSDAAGDLLTKTEADAAIKAAVAQALAATQQTSPAPEPETVTKAQLTEMVKAAVAEATAAAQERTEALAADLAKANADLDTIKQMPVPGGPVLTRTTAQQAQATKSDADRMREQAQELLAKAEQFSANRDLAQGYRDRARALLAKAAA